jgi:hypothetical protein
MVSPIGYRNEKKEQMNFISIKEWQRKEKLTGPAWRIFREFPK